jgi:predicted kinase
VGSPPDRLVVPDPSMVVLVGPAGCGKSTFARRHFRAEDVISSDACRALVAGDADDQSATADAFGLLRAIVRVRAQRRRLTVVDATSLTPWERARFRRVARRYRLPAVAVVFDLSLELCLQRAAGRTPRPVSSEVVNRQHETLRRHLVRIGQERFDDVVVFSTVEEVERVSVELQPDVRDPETWSGSPPPASRPPAVVIDLDGTLTSAAWRVHHLRLGRRDVPAFFAGMGRDAPVGPLVELAAWVAQHAAVVLLTGRPADHEPVVRSWLADHDVVYDELLMRAAGDRRPDTVVKRECYRDRIAPHYDVRLAIDDRPHVARMWREEGVYVLTAIDPRLEPLPDPTDP